MSLLHSGPTCSAFHSQQDKAGLFSSPPYRGERGGEAWVGQATGPRSQLQAEVVPGSRPGGWSWGAPGRLALTCLIGCCFLAWPWHRPSCSPCWTAEPHGAGLGVLDPWPRECWTLPRPRALVFFPGPCQGAASEDPGALVGASQNLSGTSLPSRLEPKSSWEQPVSVQDKLGSLLTASPARASVPPCLVL